MKDKMVFNFTIYYEGDDYTQFQHRYVVAETEEEAEAKLIAYRDYLVSRGFDAFGYNFNPTVEICGVIG